MPEGCLVRGGLGQLLYNCVSRSQKVDVVIFKVYIIYCLFKCVTLNCLGCSISEGSFVFISGFILCLFLVVSDDLLHPFFIPILGKFALFHLQFLVKDNLLITSEGQHC